MLKKKQILYLGLDPARYPKEGVLTHLPLIYIEPKPWSDASVEVSLRHFPHYTHLIFTSKESFRILQEGLTHFGFSADLWIHKTVIAVGKATAFHIEKSGCVSKEALFIADKECAEGVVELLESLLYPKPPHFFWPHSQLSRPLISDFCASKNLPLTDCVFYETKPLKVSSLPSLDLFDEIVFTSPSTVDAFLALFGRLPPPSQWVPIGPVTAKYLQEIASL